MSFMFVILAVASLLLALRQPAPLSLRLYLWAELLYIPPVLGGAYYFGIWSDWYVFIYSVFTMPILLAMGAIVWEAIEGRCYRLRPIAISFLLAGLLGRLAYIGLAGKVSYFAWVNLLLGVALMWAGTLLGFACRYMRRWDIGLILSLFWIGQALDRFGWMLLLSEKWNWLVPPMLGTVAFLLIGWRLRPAESRNHYVLD